MSRSGFGRQPAGRSPGGWGFVPPSDPAAGVLLRDAATGSKLGSRKIDPVTRDYVLDANGRILGMQNVPQLVQLAIHTVRDTSAIRGMGQELAKLDRITPNFERRVLGVLTEALQKLIDLGLVQVLGFSSFKSGPKDGFMPGRIFGRLLWRDMTSGREHTELI